MKVLHVIDSLGRGGAERLLADLAPELIARHIETEVISLTDTVPLAGPLRERGVKVWSLGFEGTLYSVSELLRIGTRLRKYLRAVSFDIVHSHLHTADLICRLFVPEGIKLVSTAHSTDSWWYESKRLGSIGLTWIDAGLGRVSGTRRIAVSEKVAAEAVRVLRVQRPRIRVIYNGIPVARFSAERPESAKIQRIIQVGRFVPEKGHATSLEAFSLVLQDHPEIELFLVGEGKEEARLRELATRLGIESSVSFIGARDDIPVQLSQSDLFWMPSAWEGLPIACLEAMAANLPVIASKVGGLQEIVEHGVSGFLIEPGSATQLASATNVFLQDPNLAKQFGERGRERVVREFSITVTADKYASAYSDMLLGAW
jgi:glycosyltransferase involved in cell wall biosynthesis